MDTDARTFAGGIEARQRRGAEAVDEDSSHGVVHRRANRYRRKCRIDAKKLFGQFADLRQSLAQLGMTQMTKVQMHHRTVLAFDGAALLLLMPESLAETVAWSEFHGLVAWRRLRRTETVVLKVAVAILVHQEAAFAAACLGE
ncbi:MAG: hypothetical protein AW09_000511 [Candidatus Accumulibacter phosphatis]|uniref:Uncharacterized protein n=1 Tax=Candidatus Accumulibacter phosphatis TaxID=327160 RepID=A0A080M1M2_9PROT|nr:MAG: hypothetical protein AW09_000511 [Candidatus Accumulibacter phosphatis]